MCGVFIYRQTLRHPHYHCVIVNKEKPKKPKKKEVNTAYKMDKKICAILNSKK